LWLQDFPASPSAQLDYGKEMMTKEQSFSGSEMPAASFDQTELCWKTFKESLLKEDPALLQRLPQWGTTVGGDLFEHQTHTHLIAVRDGSALPTLPTPTAQAAKHGATPDVTANAFGKNLWDIPHLLPTPVVNDMGDDKTVEWWENWIAEQKGKGRNGNGHGKSLSIEMRLLPTPTSRDHKDTGNMDYERQAKRRILPGVIISELFEDGKPLADE
tara:strand:+ start:3115 stop:3759 length:645 start_codon:yes stop_codon:yes gene_type:complete